MVKDLPAIEIVPLREVVLEFVVTEIVADPPPVLLEGDTLAQLRFSPVVHVHPESVATLTLALPLLEEKNLLVGLIE